MLNHCVPYQRLEHIVVRRNGTRTARCVTIDSHIRLRFEGVDEVDGVLFACCYVDTALVVGGETGLLGGALSGILDCCEDFGICFVGVDKDFLRDVVEATGGEDAPVEVAGCCECSQRSARTIKQSCKTHLTLFRLQQL